MDHDNQKGRDADRTVVITGGSSGLGYETAKAVLQSTANWHVMIASRDEKRTTDAAERLLERTGKQAITPMTLDLGSTGAVRTFVDELTQRIGAGTLPPLRAVVCNAGIQKVTGTAYTDDGFEATLGVNHLGHFLLVNLLAEYVTAPARFVFLAGAGTGTDGHARDSDQGLIERATGVVPPRTDFENLGDMVYPEARR